MSSNSVLIVDDTPVNLKLVRVLLSRQGFEVRTASTAEEALEMAQSFRPRLVLADIQLPGMDGLEMTRRLKAAPETHDTVVLALTAFAMKGDEEKAFAAGCDGYITKPIDTRTFPSLIREYMAKSDNSPVTAPPVRTAVTPSMPAAALSSGQRQPAGVLNRGDTGKRQTHQQPGHGLRHHGGALCCAAVGRNRSLSWSFRNQPLLARTGKSVAAERTRIHGAHTRAPRASRSRIR